MSMLSNPSGVLTKGRILIAFTLIFTWWIASLVPHYRPVVQDRLYSKLQAARQQIPSIKVDWHPTDDPRANYNASKLALIIEPRPIPHLVPQLLHMTQVVPPDWRFLFIGTPNSVASVGRSYAIKHQQVIGKLDLMVLPEPWEIESKEHVFRLLTDERFYDDFLPGVEWILKFEADSILCSNSDSSLNDWLHWSWAGAPRTPEDRFSGNGGLSLRRVSAIKRVLKFQERYNDTEPEDEWFGRRVWVLPGERVASGSEGVLAVEDVFMEKPMGYHIRAGGSGIADTVWKDPEQRKKIFDHCPELSLIMDMKLERERCPDDNHEGGLGPTDAELAAQKEAQERKQQEEASAAAAAAAAAEKQKQEEEARKQKEQEEAAAKKKLEDEAKRKQQQQQQQQPPPPPKPTTGTIGKPHNKKLKQASKPQLPANANKELGAEPEKQTPTEGQDPAVEGDETPTLGAAVGAVAVDGLATPEDSLFPRTGAAEDVPKP